jgi:3-hydroxyacyl-CoA dehydrogenase
MCRSLSDSLLEKNVQKGKMTAAERTDTLARIRPTTRLEDLAAADYIVEAVSENYELKKSIFANLCRITSETTILSTNTSSISISKIAGATGNRRDKVGVSACVRQSVSECEREEETEAPTVDVLVCLYAHASTLRVCACMSACVCVWVGG